MRRCLASTLACLLAFGPGLATAAPQGENVVYGEADFARDGDLTVITTHTPQTIVEYTGFDIGASETVRIDQPDAASRILNQVLASDPTRVDGRLLSNGQVWIVNPVGVFFGDRAVVDVGGLVAAAGHVEAGAFLDGDVHFSDLAGPVEVAAGAEIRAADRVLLVGRTVANHGAIRAADGMIALVAGGEARLARVDGRVVIQVDPGLAPDPGHAAVVQAGHLDAGRGEVHLAAGDAWSLAMNHSGVTRAAEITVAGGAEGVVEVSGRLDASNDAPGGRGGRIEVTGDLVLLDGATLEASGEAGGGEILVGGDAHGGGETRTARRTYVSQDSTLRADALVAGDGGRIIVWADDATAFYGALSARGGPAGGDGGFAEISGAQRLISRATVDLGAPAGEVGTLLYDPARILITGSAGVPTDGSDADDGNPPEFFLVGDGGTAGSIGTADTGDGSTPFVIYESEIEGTNANIVLQASQSIETTGEFLGDDVSITPGRDLTLEVVDAGEDVAPGGFVGIDVATDGSGDPLTWILSGGGTLRMTTTSFEGRDSDLPADISVGAIETSGVRPGTANNVALFVTGLGSIDVGSIDTSGEARIGDGSEEVNGITVDTVDAGNVTLLTQTGNITVGSIDARGGDASALEPGDGGDGGDVVVSTLHGRITVGSIDASGGDGFVALVDDGAGGLRGEGRGGDGGVLSLVADLDPADPDLALPVGGDARVVEVTGDLVATGGDGLGEATDGATVFGADGGEGGQIFASAGHLAGEGRVEIGTAADPVRLDVSGGDGTANGGSAGSGQASAFTGAAVGGIRIEAQDDVEVWAELVATGGDAGWDAASAAAAGSGGAAGNGGDVSFASVAGNASLFDVGATPGVVLDGGSVRTAPGEPLAGLGGDAGSLVAEVAGAGAAVSLLADVSARGGDGNDGAGGDGGSVTLAALDGTATLFGVDSGGGSGSGSLAADPDAGIEAQGALGGDGGDVVVTTQAGEDGSGAGGDVLLGGAIATLGGAGVADPDGDVEDPRENHGLAGTVRLVSAGDVDAAPGAGTPSLTSSTIEIEGRNVFASGAADLLLSSSGDTSPASVVDTATVQAEGDARILLDDQGDTRAFERLELIETEASGSFDVLREDGTTVVVRATGAGDVHTLQEITTDASDPHLTYRLDDPLESGDGGAEQIDATTLEIASGAVSLGANGGKLANARGDDTALAGERLLGGIQVAGAGPHVTTAGNLELYGTRVGDETPLVVAGTGGPALELGVAGDVDLDVSGGIALVDLTQRRAGGGVELGFAGGDGVSIEGTVFDDGASRVEASRITRIDTDDSGVSFFFELADVTASSNPSAGGEPVLAVSSGAVTLGADAGIATTGDLVLEGDAGPAIAAGGATVVLVADTNVDGRGAIVASGSGAPDLVDAGGLVAIAGGGVGSEEAPLRTRAFAGELAVAGASGGGFYLENDNPGAADALVVREITVSGVEAGVSEDESASGQITALGDVVLDNQGGPIVLGAIGSQPELLDGFEDPAHVSSIGSQRFGGDVLLGNPLDGEHRVFLFATDEVSFEGDVDTHPDQLDPLAADPGSLTVLASNTIFAGDVGGTVATAGGTIASVESLTTGDLELTAGDHAVTVASGDFGRIAGPGALFASAIGEGGRLRFGGDVGVGAALATFSADADLVLFDGADRVTAGAIRLNTATPSASVPDAATIADTGGGLLLQSDGEIEMGRNEKLSANGRLEIRAGDTATLGDVSATDLRVDAPRIVILGRAGGPVALPDGSSLQDGGVDWVANAIETNVIPEWDGQGAAPVFALGSGGIRIAGGGGRLPFDTVRFTRGGHEIRSDELFDGARVLDLTGTGPRVVSDPSDDVPREVAAVAPPLEARFGDTPPAPPAPVTGEDLLATVQCRSAEGGLCLPESAGDDALSSERAREIAERYHALLRSEEGRRALVAAFEPLGSLAPGVEGDVLYGVLASRRATASARERVDELAEVFAQVSLLGLDDAGARRVRDALAHEFAEAARLPGLDAGLVVATVAASGVGALPPRERAGREP